MELGLMPYGEALELQREVARQRIAGEIVHDVLMLVEHPHVVTLGRSYKGATLTASPELLSARGVEVFEVERGGDVTYHGPGQLVGYPIFDLKQHKRDLHWYLRQVEEALIVALRGMEIEGRRSTGYTGVWVGQPVSDEAGSPGVVRASALVAEDGSGLPASAVRQPRKIASIGVHARDWVTWHGFALNVTTDLSYFDLMVPCGIDQVRMTSIQAEQPGLGLDVQEAGRRVARAFAQVFEHQTGAVSLGAL
jgi:lipoyl(octanoyl) transferase